VLAQTHPSSKVAPFSTLGDLWTAKRVEAIAWGACAEIRNSLAPIDLYRWVRANRRNDAQLVELFCMSTRLRPHVTDDSHLGVYSRTNRAKVYRSAADRMPKLLVLAAFADPAVVRSMWAFMAQWTRAEETMPDDLIELLESLDMKDRGPFLYWLLNERTVQHCSAPKLRLLARRRCDFRHAASFRLVLHGSIG
jgi:hypothetical protein